MRGLLVDRDMPTSQARWRQVIAKSLVDTFQIDIFVKREERTCAEMPTRDIEMHYERTREFMGYGDYDVLIFDPEYAFMQKWNVDFDGLQYIGKCDASYMFSHKKWSKKLEFEEYDFFYYMFRANYMTTL